MIDLGTVRAIPVGEGRAYRVGERTIAVFRAADRELHALDDRCPRLSGALADGIVGKGIVTCSPHGWRFELASGRCLDEPVHVRPHRVLLVAGRMILQLED